MANNDRQIIKNKIKSAENDILRTISNIDTIMELYDTSGLPVEDIKECIFNCTMMSIETGKHTPMEIYRIMLREKQVPYLGRYEQHLFRVGLIQQTAQAMYDAIQDFKLWEVTA